jgi:hypothetical protein
MLEEGVTGRRRQPAVRWARKVAWLVVPLALVGEFGHYLLERLGQTLAHHFFHILFAGGAAVIFGAFVLVDVRRHGWPTFSWRARPPPSPGPLGVRPSGKAPGAVGSRRLDPRHQGK